MCNGTSKNKSTNLELIINNMGFKTSHKKEEEIFMHLVFHSKNHSVDFTKNVGGPSERERFKFLLSNLGVGRQQFS